jgi:hypothetical protein
VIRATFALVAGLGIPVACSNGAMILAGMFPVSFNLLERPPWRYLVFLLFANVVGALLGGWAAARIYQRAPRTVGVALGGVLFAVLLWQCWGTVFFRPTPGIFPTWWYALLLVSIFFGSSLGGVCAAVLAKYRPSRLGA